MGSGPALQFPSQSKAGAHWALSRVVLEGWVDRFRRSLWYSWFLGFIERSVVGTETGAGDAPGSAVLVFEMMGNTKGGGCSQLRIQSRCESSRP